MKDFKKLCLIFGLLTLSSNFVNASNLSSYETELLSQINIYRQENKLTRLMSDDHLNQLAQNHSQFMLKNNNLSHDNFKERFNLAKRRSCVENVGWNYKTGKDQFVGWKNSSGHNVNMLNNKITQVGISKVGSYVTFFACQ